MADRCANCGWDLSAETTRGKIGFCVECSKKVAPFIKFISQSKISSVRLLDVNVDKLQEMGITEGGIAYLRRCCLRYDAKKKAQAQTQAQAQMQAQTQAQESQISEKAAGTPAITSKTAQEISEPADYDDDDYEKTRVAPVVAPNIKQNNRSNDTKDIAYNDYEDIGYVENVKSQRKKRKPKGSVIIVTALVLVIVAFTALYVFGVVGGGFLFGGNHQDGKNSSGSESITVRDIPGTADDNTSSVDETNIEPGESTSGNTTDNTDTTRENESSDTVCNHQWKEATCTEPRTCTICGATEGEALGHKWKEATCTEPKKCTVCGATEGEALGHKWAEATCTEPKKCTVCGATEGKALGHKWVHNAELDEDICSVCGITITEVTLGRPCTHNWAPATCTEPKKCTICGSTRGEPLGHSWVEATCTTPKTCSVCGATTGVANGHTVSGITCTVCGQVVVTINEVGVTYSDASGIDIRIDSIDRVMGGDVISYYITYTMTNTTQSTLHEGTFKLFLENGSPINQSGVFADLSPGETRTKIAVFNITAEGIPMILEFNYDEDENDLSSSYFRTVPSLTSLYWRLP